MSENSSLPENKIRIVTLGGGTGQMAVLAGLKKYTDTADITAVVSMADNGGSTGILRDELGVLPPGDVRKCLIALADESSVMRKLFEYRFTLSTATTHISEQDPALLTQTTDTHTLAGHSFGNLFLSALEKVTGSLPTAIEEASRILRVRGQVLPVTTTSTNIEITTKTGKKILGEKYLDDEAYIREHGVAAIRLTGDPILNPHVHETILAADCVVIGPGDIYGSVLPCLLVPGLREALVERKQAHKNFHIVLVANATNKPNLTSAWTVSDYLATVESHLGTGMVTDCIANNAQPLRKLVDKYTKHYGEDVLVACDTLPLACTPHYNNLLKQYDPDAHEVFIRHDEHLLANMIIPIANTGAQ